MVSGLGRVTETLNPKPQAHRTKTAPALQSARTAAAAPAVARRPVAVMGMV